MSRRDIFGMQKSSGTWLPLLFFFNDTATTEIYTLSLHDALPIFDTLPGVGPTVKRKLAKLGLETVRDLLEHRPRSEEHTSELQSRLHLVCRLLLEKKKSRGGHCRRRCAHRQFLHEPGSVLRNQWL